MKAVRSALPLGLAALAAIYVADLVVARLRGDAAFGSVRMNVYYAIPEKAARMDFTPGQPETDECVRALFPHFGDAPCWYAERHTLKRVDL